MMVSFRAKAKLISLKNPIQLATLGQSFKIRIAADQLVFDKDDGDCSPACFVLNFLDFIFFSSKIDLCELDFTVFEEASGPVTEGTIIL